MSPRQKFDRYMLVIGAGRNRKFVRFTDSERCAHFLGVLALAAQHDPRGYLTELDPLEISNEAGGGVTEKVAASAIEKLKVRKVLKWDETVGAWYVHDWDEINPTPGAERTRRWRDGQGDDNGDGSVTPERHGKRHNGVTGTSPEVKKLEGEVETSSSQAQKSARRRAPRKQVDQSEFPPSLPSGLHQVATVTLGILHGVWEQRGGLEPMHRGVGLAVAAFPDRAHPDVARSVEHWLIAGNGRDADCGDVVARFRRFLSTSPPASRATGSNVVSMRPAALQHADRWRAGYEESAS